MIENGSYRVVPGFIVLASRTNALLFLAPVLGRLGAKALN